MRKKDEKTYCYFSAIASETTAADLVIVSKVTGRGDGMGMNVAGGAAVVQAQALEYDLTAAEVTEAAHGTAAYFGGKACAGKNMPAACLASALANRGRTNGNKATTGRNPDALRLGEQIGSEVMGSERWKKYITTSAQHMNEADKPAPAKVTRQWAKERIVDERKGWVFHHIHDRIKVDNDRPDHLYAARIHQRKSLDARRIVARSYFRSLQTVNWTRFSKARNKD